MTQKIFITYLIAFALYTIVDFGLELLNISYVKKTSNAIPEFFKAWFDKETYQKSTAYTLTKANFGLISSLFSTIFLLLFICLSWFGYLDNFISSKFSSKYSAGIVYILSISFIFSIISVPFSLYSQFVIEERFGFNKMTLKLWFSDFLKSTFISFFITIPIILVLFCFMDSAGRYWWVYAWAFIFIFQFILATIFPVFIAPLFNKFEPLKDDSLSEKIKLLSDKLNFKNSGIFVMDGSKRSTHSNAYFAGFGRFKRIVLFDTMIEQLGEKGVLAVLAHEIGHEKLKHILKNLVVSGLLMLIIFYAISLLVDYTPFYQAFGFSTPSYHALFVLFSIAMSPVMFFISPLFSIMSRKFEYEADEFAVKAVGNSKDLSDSLLKMSEKNLSNLTPHPMYSFFHYSHPTLYERIKAMEGV